MFIQRLFQAAEHKYDAKIDKLKNRGIIIVLLI